METNEQTLTGRQVRARLFERDITVTDLARAAGMHQQNLSAILAGRMYVGPARRARIERAIAELGLDREQPAAPSEPTFTIRRGEESE